MKLRHKGDFGSIAHKYKFGGLRDFYRYKIRKFADFLSTLSLKTFAPAAGLNIKNLLLWDY